MVAQVNYANFATESYQQFGDKRFLTTPLMKWMYDLYTTDPKQRKEIYAFGLLNGLAELPATRSLFVQAAAELKKYLQ